MAHITELLPLSLPTFIHECPSRSQNYGLDGASAAFALTPSSPWSNIPRVTQLLAESREEARPPDSWFSALSTAFTPAVPQESNFSSTTDQLGDLCDFNLSWSMYLPLCYRDVSVPPQRFAVRVSETMQEPWHSHYSMEIKCVHPLK